MRGVFLTLFLLLLISPNLSAAQLSGEFVGMIGTDKMSSTLSLDIEPKNKSWLHWIWGCDASLGLHDPWPPQVKTRWRWSVPVPIAPDGKVLMSHNLPHFTSADAFRLIDKNQYNTDSFLTCLQTPQLKVGILNNVPFKTSDIVDAVFVENVLTLGPLALTGVHVRYAGATESGNTDAIQAKGKFGVIETLAAQGWHTDFQGDEHQAVVLEAAGRGNILSGTFVVQRIDPGFISPLAKTNRFTPNRQGWQLELSSEFKTLGLSLNLRRLTSRDGSRNYNQLGWKLDAKDKHTSLEWRIQPTHAFIMRYDLGERLFQFDPVNATLRTDFNLYGGVCSVRLDAMRSILRLEYKGQRLLEWRAIAKYDFIRSRSHFSLRIRHAGKDHELEIEIGEYDKGNMSSGFNNSPGFCISWGWKF